MPSVDAAREARRDREAVAQVALAVAQHLVVRGQHQRVEAGGLRALGEGAGQLAVAVHEHLHPARRRRPAPADPRSCRSRRGSGSRPCRPRRRRGRRRARRRARAGPTGPVGPISTGSASRRPNSSRLWSRAVVPSSGRGRSVSSPNAASLRRRVRSSSAPPSTKSKIGRGRMRRASRRASVDAVEPALQRHRGHRPLPALLRRW